MEDRKNLEALHFEEFLEICSDSGLIKEETAREIISFAKAIGGVGAVPRLTGKKLSGTDDFSASLISVYPEGMTFNNYVTTEENYYATEIARTIALIPRVWKSITPVMLHADTGQGKTHLLAAIARSTHKTTIILNTVDLHIEYQQCLKAGMEKELRDWITSYELLMLDDIQFSQGDLQFQKFLISVVNRMPRGKHGIITASDVPPGKLLDIDPSFYSRLISGLVIKLETVNLEGRKEILRNLFGQTGVKPEDEILDFIATHVTLNIRQLKAAGRMVLAQMLGPAHDVNIRMVNDILSFMQVYRKKEGLPRASQLNVRDESEAAVNPSPFIVVDIDEETGKIDTPPESASESVEPPGIDDDHIFKKETTASVSYDEPSDTSKYKNMVESAQTVDNQIEALKQAVADRIEQLKTKSVDSREIDKLRFALTFLNQGKLESAMLALRPD